MSYLQLYQLKRHLILFLPKTKILLESQHMSHTVLPLNISCVHLSHLVFPQHCVCVSLTKELILITS